MVQEESIPFKLRTRRDHRVESPAYAVSSNILIRALNKVPPLVRKMITGPKARILELLRLGDAAGSGMRRRDR